MAKAVHVDPHLDFNPLPDSPWIDNAVIPINNHFRLSVSMNKYEGLWYVGEHDSYEVAIMATETEGGEGALVFFNGDTVQCDCSMRDIRRLMRAASRLVYVGRIEVFDVGGKSVCPDGQPRWLTRFHCAKGEDLQQKLKYANRVWGKDRHRFIQYIP